jgi:hypothetical protein
MMADQVGRLVGDAVHGKEPQARDAIVVLAVKSTASRALRAT